MNRRKRNRRCFRLIVFLLLFTGVLVLLRFRYMPFLREAARTRVINVASDRINDAIYAQIASGSIDYSRVVCLEKNTNGEITALRTNMAEINQLKAETLALLSEQLMEMDTEELKIPIGSILMPEFLAGKGPGLPIRVVALSTTDADFYSEFTSAGINQTHQRILLEIKICMSVLTPAGTESVDVASVIVVAETVIVGSVAYTGWKMIGVVPESVQAANYKNFRYYVFATILVLLVMLLEGNQLVSRKISKPIRELDASVKAHEAGGKPDIYIGGSSEIRHLGHSVQKSYEQIEKLMDEIIRQQNERRKSELDALQSQINPHFLYNTLESITWMVEAQENEAAVRMISELAKLLRVSLSRGKTIIPIKDELQHSRSYMNIQLARYKERFKTEFRIEEEIENCCIVKLVIQPILENAIYYGVGNMDEDDDGMIIVSGKKKDEDILITIEDNGMGMREEVLENILTDNSKVPKHGSGVGVINVHSRIRLMFGEEYGLSIESEPDEGTRVTIRIPAIPYTPENAEALELQKYIQRRPGG